MEFIFHIKTAFIINFSTIITFWKNNHSHIKIWIIFNIHNSWQPYKALKWTITKRFTFKLQYEAYNFLKQISSDYHSENQCTNEFWVYIFKCKGNN